MSPYDESGDDGRELLDEGGADFRLVLSGDSLDRFCDRFIGAFPCIEEVGRQGV